MNNEQFKFGIKLTVSIAIIAVGIIIGILIYVFTVKRAEPNIYSEILSEADKEVDMTEINEIALESKGIDKDEFESYLSTFGLLIKTYPELSDEEQKNTQMIDAAINFLSNIYMYDASGEEVQATTFEAEKVNKVIKEMNGIYISKNLNVSKEYMYDEANNTYVSNDMEYPKCLLIETSELSKKDDKIETIFKVAFPKENEIVDYTEKKKVEFETYTVKATILENEDYEYSKYYVSDIRVIEKEDVTYN